MILPAKTLRDLREFIEEMSSEEFEEIADLPVRIEDEDGIIDQEMTGLDTPNGFFITVGQLPDHIWE